MGFLGGIVDWLVSWSDSPYAPLVLFVVSLLDSATVFLPPEPLLISMSVAQPNRALLYAAIATASSVLGATITYYVGRLGGRPLAERFVRGERIEAAEDFFQDHGTLTTGIAAFTPEPYPVFALAAGITHFGVWSFILASLAGRGARFFGIGLAIYFFGAAIQQFLENYLGWATLAVGVVLILVYVISHYTSSRFERKVREKQE
ncbi:MAG: VTT domain-containing protein [Actinomycetota bacterium]|nr:VTT domain-containing protein [Actinomycetota bacterium]